MFHSMPLMLNYEDSFAVDADTCSSSIISDFSCVSSSISQGPLLLISFSLSSSFSFSSCCWKTMALKWGCLTFVQSQFPLCVFSKRHKKEDEREKKAVFYASPLVFVCVLRVPDSWLPINLHTCLQLISLQSANLPVSLFIAKLLHLPCIVTHAKGRIGRLFYHLRLFCLPQVLRKKNYWIDFRGTEGEWYEREAIKFGHISE